MIGLDPLVDNTDSTLEDVFKKIVPQCEEVRVATGYFYLSEFNLIKEDLDNLLDRRGYQCEPYLLYRIVS